MSKLNQTTVLGQYKRYCCHVLFHVRDLVVNMGGYILIFHEYITGSS